MPTSLAVTGWKEACTVTDAHALALFGCRRSTLGFAAVFVWAVGLATSSANDEIPGAPQAAPVALVGGTLHPVSGPPIARGTILFESGKIVELGVDVELDAATVIVDVSGRHVYPGLFAAHSHLGLVEISSVRGTLDTSESGDFNPNLEAQRSVQPDSEILPVTRSGGVLLALTAPRGGRIAGMAAVLQLDGWTYEDMTLASRTALVLAWPNVPPVLKNDSPREGGESSDERKAGESASAGGVELLALRRFFDDARAYEKAALAHREGNASARAKPAVDARLAALRPVLSREVPILVEANELSRIQSAVAFAVEQDIRLILLGGYDAPACAELLRRHDVAVIVSAVHRLPRRRDDPYDAAYTLPERLRAAGVRYCISCSGRSIAANVRNLPHHAATAVAFGLPPDEALKAITLYPARILGVEARVGSLETGKDATVIITTGDPLQITTRVEAAYIQGRAVDLSDRQKRLYEKYREKYRRLRPAER